MADALLGAVAAALIAVGASGFAAVVGRPRGVPASVAVLVPLAEAARSVRRARFARPRAADLLPLGCAALQAAVAIAGIAVPLLLLLLVVPDVIAARRSLGRRATGARAAVLLLALASPLVLTRGAGLAAAQSLVWFAVQVPAALVVLLIATARWAPGRPGGALVGAGRAGLFAAGCLAAAALLLGGPAWLPAKAAVLAAVLVVAAARFPALRPAAATRLAVGFGLPLAALQLLVAFLLP